MDIRRFLNFTIIVILFTIFSGELKAQEDLWTTLGDIEWYQKYSETYGAEIGFPKFNEEAKKLNGKEVSIRGYMLPLDTEDGSVVISALPYSSCFFCGGAGIETVMAVFMKNPRKFEMEQVTFRGKLELNETETGLIYNLKEAVEVEE
ncbi:hypothetical protein [Flexithrix dorotheae]|uniref:hypothetical protein n=1 Tax=Flexithrix dorotheae TaxID=70993 RepID=UPI0003698D01|nr:hypothetical protein [Flexithrix dorotheae]